MSMSINPVDLAAAAEGILNTQYLLQRERLLSASAQASRLLLEAPDAMKAMPEVLQLLGEAAQVDRTALAFAEIGPNGEKWLKIQAEWVTESLTDAHCPMSECGGTDPWNEPRSDQFCTMLQSGKSVVFCPDAARAIEGVSITSDKARTSAIVPILVDGEYVGVIGFDDWQRVREFDSSIVSALEIAAGLVGAALHRQRLVETMRRERELAAEERLSSATRANALLRSNLTKLARDADPQDFVSNILIDATRQLDAAAAYTIGFDKAANLWKAFIHVEGGKVAPPPYQAAATPEETRLGEVLTLFTEPSFYQVQPLDRIQWPGAAAWHAREGHKSVYLLPVVVGEQTVGCIGLAFMQDEALSAERAELALAVAHQITLCIGLKKLGMAAKDAAVLAERNRIGQEIHDGLAQGFTGILMQLGAAEEAMHECARNSPLPSILTRIHDLARQGLADARRSVMALRPDQTKRVGLELALRQLAERATVEGRATCSFEGAVIGDGLVPERQHELLRIATEAVSNALRHAHPTTVRIVLLEEIAQWTMSVIDDGRGMTLSPDLYAQQGYGLNNMRERAGAIGGEFLIESKPGEGTRIVVNLPRPHAANVSKLKAQHERRG
jgi:signal transduction histidine kinase